MTERVCPGLTADWLNAWLAAVGTTVLNDAISLRWTTDGVPVAVLSVDGPADPLDVVVASWPSEERLAAMPLVSEWPGEGGGRHLSVDAFTGAARLIGSSADAWVLSSTVTDLQVDVNGMVAHAPFHPPGPKPSSHVGQRLPRVHSEVRRPPEQVPRTLAGRGSRVVANGLGFDLTRVTTQADQSKKTVDPVIEVLAFFGLAFLPVRGAGVDQRMHGARSRVSSRQRGWRRTPQTYFSWPVWRHPIDRAGIDALLDAWHERDDPTYWDRLGVHAAWRTVRYASDNPRDPTRGYGSERL